MTSTMVLEMNLPTADLDHILEHTPDVWEELRGESIFITGGTGFFGAWLLESFAFANRELDLGAEAVVLTRNPADFATRMPHLAADPSIGFQAGDVRSFEFPKRKFSYVLHAATQTDSLAAPLSPAILFEANVAGTRRILEYARACRARKFLFTSSGAVYGGQPSNLTHVPEEYLGAPSPTEAGTAYGQSKRVSEFLCAAAGASVELEIKIARCFAFVGPYLPLDANYAIGNFIADALQNRSIRVKGDGTPWRSYLYAADLVIWLWTILVRGQSARAYNVGSDADLTIEQLARLVVDVVNPRLEVVVAQEPSGAPAQRYVPSIGRARAELGLQAWTSLRESIERTAQWYKTHKR